MMYVADMLTLTVALMLTLIYLKPYQGPWHRFKFGDVAKSWWLTKYATVADICMQQIYVRACLIFYFMILFVQPETAA